MKILDYIANCQTKQDGRVDLVELRILIPDRSHKKQWKIIKLYFKNWEVVMLHKRALNGNKRTFNRQYDAKRHLPVWDHPNNDSYFRHNDNKRRLCLVTIH